MACATCISCIRGISVSLDYPWASPFLCLQASFVILGFMRYLPNARGCEDHLQSSHPQCHAIYQNSEISSLRQSRIDTNHKPVLQARISSRSLYSALGIDCSSGHVFDMSRRGSNLFSSVSTKDFFTATAMSLSICGTIMLAIWIGWRMHINLDL